ncbi:hypothetical protein GO283_00098 [Ralstonia solanacearum]|nr:hypothetical protein [Ralstonia solanacearum]NJZ76344.1 hypothetical protein [Ralstonia solanacearum]NJZ84682.1 hypothetical protein [Ralstonia solanacearum]NKA32726.1 hypothetical protein [Ralstonia solanacearum]NKA71705.1 hypothetical protein [Ralstonia solanacearum]
MLSALHAIALRIGFRHGADAAGRQARQQLPAMRRRRGAYCATIEKRGIDSGCLPSRP